MRFFTPLLILGIVFSACTAPPEPIASPEPTVASGPTPAPTFAIPPRLITQAARQRGQLGSAPNKPYVSSKPSVRIPTLAPIVKTWEISSTATPRPEFTLHPTATRYIVAVGEQEFFVGEAADAVKRGDVHFGNGEYNEAITSFQEAKRFLDEPSPLLENRIGMTYGRLEQYDLAILHFSMALEIKDNAPDRINRSRAYRASDQCAPAIADAKVVLAMEPQKASNYHSHAIANSILSFCYFEQGNSALAMQHIDTAITVAQSHKYRASDLNELMEAREIIKDAQQ